MATLHRDHQALEDCKDRNLETLALQLHTQRSDGPILCLVGPPGVGKTSMARSIAEAMGREYCRIALVGVRDEASIRGHRRAYIGAMPGRIVQGSARSEHEPLMLLDEIDKLEDYRGDPSHALLEVLIPASAPPSPITTSTWSLTCRRSSSSAPRTASRGSLLRSWIGWRSSSCPPTP